MAEGFWPFPAESLKWRGFRGFFEGGFNARTRWRGDGDPPEGGTPYSFAELVRPENGFWRNGFACLQWVARGNCPMVRNRFGFDPLLIRV
jgi:hypothetical protein